MRPFSRWVQALPSNMDKRQDVVRGFAIAGFAGFLALLAVAI
jgi:hypothetical protein